MKNSNLFSKMVYVDNIEELENNWIECIKELENTEFHKIYYEFTKNRLIKDLIYKLKIDTKIYKKSYQKQSYKKLWKIETNKNRTHKLIYSDVKPKKLKHESHILI
jgi:hypothetical protein